jgi:RecA-family ATPase
MYFKAAVTNTKGEDADPDLRLLEFRKNNYGPINASMELRWTSGLYLPAPSFNEFEQDVRDRGSETVFLDLLARFTADGRTVSSNSGKNYAPAVFAEEGEAKRAGVSNAMLVKAMQRLFEAKRIKEQQHGSPSRVRSRLVIV